MRRWKQHTIARVDGERLNMFCCTSSAVGQMGFVTFPMVPCARDSAHAGTNSGGTAGRPKLRGNSEHQFQSQNLTIDSSSSLFHFVSSCL